MLPVKPLDANLIYKGPTPKVGDLECTRIRPGLIKSQWRLSEDELSFLNAGGLVELCIYTEPIPPISLNVNNPFCPECMVTMEMEYKSEDIPARWRFRCPRCKQWVHPK